MDAFNVKTSGVDHNASSLSGGNLQKFIMGREILQIQISRFDKVIKTFDTTHAALAAISLQAADAYGGR